MEKRKSSLLSGFQKQEERFREHLPEAEKLDHTLVRTDVKEKSNIIKNKILEIFAFFHSSSRSLLF